MDIKSNIIEVEHPNGFKGVLYGKKSMAIYRPDGSECLHTGDRGINTTDELYEQLENMPTFLELLFDLALDDDEDDFI